jgi:hypothetical protein
MGVYTDNFNRANGSLGANWTDLLNGLVITSNLCDGASGALNVGYWSANSVAAYQYSQIVSAGTFIGQLFGPAVRCSETDNCYWLAVNSAANTATIRLLSSGSGSAIGSAISIATVAAGQTFRLEVDGTTLRSYRNGTLLDTITDATHSSGQPGIVIQANGEFDRADNWEGGDLNSGDIGSSAGVATAGFVGLGLNSEGVPASDLVAWFRSDSEVTESAGRVSAWGDKTANGNDIAQATAGNQPLLVADGEFMAGTIPFIRLVGSRNDYLAQTGAGNGGSPWTYAAVCRKTELGTFEWLWGANESYRCIGIHSNNRPVLFAGGVAGHSNYTVPGTWGLLVGVFNGASSELFWNGVSSGTIDMGAGTTSGEGLMLGSDPGSGGSGCDYDVAELFRWDRALGSAELAALTAYILETYGPLFTARYRADTHVLGHDATVAYSDDFNRANGAIGANWSALDSGAAAVATIVSNEAVGTGGGANWSYWSANSIGADQFSEVVIGTIGTNGTAPIVRAVAGAGGDAYYLYINQGARTARIWKVDAGSFSAVGSEISIPAVVAGQVFRLEVEGTTLRAYRNGTLIDTTTDSSHASGQPGFLFDSNTTPAVNAWAGGELGDVVSAWGDMGLGSFYLAQATVAEQPARVASGINSEPVIRFTRAGGSNLERASTPVMAIQPFAWATYVTGLVAHTSEQWLITTEDQYRGLLFNASEQFTGFAGDTGVYDATAIDGNPHSLIGNITGGSNTANGWVDGVLGSAAPVTVNASGGAAGNGIRIGDPTSGDEISIDVAEAFLFDHDLSADEVAWLQAYFVERYETASDDGVLEDADGVATADFVGASAFDGAVAANGVATAAFTGQAAGDGALASDGVAVGSFEGVGHTETMLLSEGVAGVTWVGITNTGLWISQGEATGAFVGAYAVDAVWSSNGAAFCLFSDAINGVLATEGAATCAWVGSALGGDNWIPEAAASDGWTPEASL